MLGERRTFKVIVDFLAKVHPELISKNLELVAEFGRWDDLFVLLDTQLKGEVVALIKKQLKEDLATDYPSLLGKWLKSENTSSNESRRVAKILITALGMTPREYRKMLTNLRNKINIVETAMSSGKWTEIDYAKVPSRAMKIYRNAFQRHDNDGFAEFIGEVKTGEKKINASTLYPYDILEAMTQGGRFSLETRYYGGATFKYDEVLEQQWKALPNYVEGENNVLVMADTSASMNGRPMATSVGLAIYFAERNKGIFKDVFMTFSERPSFVQLKGETLYEKIKCVPSIVANTNLEATFNLILDTAVKNNLAQKDLPKSLVIITDGQFDYMVDGGGRNYNTLYDSIEQKFNRYGYEMMNIIFWNVNSVRDSFQVTSDKKGVQLVSGYSTSTFKTVLKNIGYNPFEAMINTLSDERYSVIKV